MFANGLHIGAVGDLEHETSDYRYTSLDAECLVKPMKPLLLPICCYNQVGTSTDKANLEHEPTVFLFFKVGCDGFFLLIINELQNILKISENKFGRMKLWYYLWRIN